MKAKMFDLTPAVGFVLHIGEEMSRGQELTRNGLVLDHGGLAMAPAPEFWVEWAGLTAGGVPGKTGIYARRNGDGLVGMLVTSGPGGLDDVPTAQFLISWLDADRVLIAPEATELDDELPLQGGLMFTAALVAINAKQGVRIKTEHPHIGRARTLRQSGFGELLPHHIVTIDGFYSEPSDGSGAGSPKAFHFVRSHGRDLPSGVRVKVRAHWRGDPALGICQSDYRLRGRLPQ